MKNICTSRVPVNITAWSLILNYFSLDSNISIDVMHMHCDALQSFLSM